jgi:signal transduction histidine kinase
MGIPEENIERIFNPFYTTKHESKEREGTGLGLSIVQEIITEHNGFIQVKSELGKGTTFLVNLPIDLSEFEQKEDRRRA